MSDVDTTSDAVGAFRAGLSPQVRHQLHHTARVASLAHRAVHTHGWTPTALAHECMRDHNGAVNPAGIVMHRLEWAAEHPPATSSGPARLPFCTPECKDNGGMILDPQTLLPLRKCDCRTRPPEANA